MKNRYIEGDNNVIDDITGFKHKASEMRKLQGEQKGLITHYTNWNPANPQLIIKTKAEDQTVRTVRLRQSENFITTPVTSDDL